MSVASKIREALGVAEDSGEVMSRLLLAAKEDPAFRVRVLMVLQLPASQRESVINTAIEEMRLSGESRAVRAAFAALATDGGAEAARKFLCEK